MRDYPPLLWWYFVAVAVAGLALCTLIYTGGAIVPSPIIRCARGFENYTLVSFKIRPDGTEYDCHYVKHVSEAHRGR